MSSEENAEATINVNPGRELPWLETGKELLVIDTHGGQSSWPVCRAVMQIGRANSRRTNDIILEGQEIAERQAVLQFQQGQVLFLNLNATLPVQRKGVTSSFFEMQLNEEVTLGGFRLKLVPRQEGLAHLEGYSYPYRGRRWMLLEGANAVGRPGKRDNRIQLEDLTVSRTHATLDCEDGQFFVKPDTEAIPTFVNGHKIAEPRLLQDGDLIQLGVQILRFRRAKGKPVEGSLEARPATILFADIWNYSALSESRPLDELIRQVGDFYEMVEGVVSANRGRLTSYLGDSAVAVFGADGHGAEDPVRAVEAALGMQKGMEDLNRGWLQCGLPPFRIGVGIHTGEVVLGDISLRGQAELAAVGGQADLVAQIEKLTRQYDAKVLISQPTAAYLGEQYSLTSLGPVQLENGQPAMELFDVAEKAPRPTQGP